MASGTGQASRSRVRKLLERAFFSQDTVLKLSLNDRNQCYLQWGWKAGDCWEWKIAKMADVELGEILLVLEGKKEQCSFFHESAKGRTQIWIRRSGGYCTFKVKECSKSLTENEQKVLELLIRHVILMMSLSLGRSSA